MQGTLSTERLGLSFLRTALAIFALVALTAPASGQDLVTVDISGPVFPGPAANRILDFDVFPGTFSASYTIPVTGQGPDPVPCPEGAPLDVVACYVLDPACSSFSLTIGDYDGFSQVVAEINPDGGPLVAIGDNFPPDGRDLWALFSQTNPDLFRPPDTCNLFWLDFSGVSLDDTSYFANELAPFLICGSTTPGDDVLFGPTASLGVSDAGTCVKPALVLAIDEDSIDNGSRPNRFSAEDVNDGGAGLGVRDQLPFFANNVGETITLHTGAVGDEGWFALPTIPDSWADAGPTNDGLRNFVGLPVGPGLGTGNDPEALLDEVPDVTPLGKADLELLTGERVCAVVFDSDIGINDDPPTGSLKGANLGTVAFAVLDVRGGKRRPKVDIEILDADEVCNGELKQ